VSLSRTIRPSLSRWTLLFLALALSVFAWGLKYKLSLYDPPQAQSHSMPEAKLLSKNELPSIANDVLLKGVTGFGRGMQFLLNHLYFLVLLLVSPYVVALVRLSILDLRRPGILALFDSWPAFSFRPPPVLS
jgi:hypothetical protein